MLRVSPIKQQIKTGFFLIHIEQLSSESQLKSEISRLKEKSDTLEDLLKAKAELFNAQLKEFSEVKKQKDSLELTNNDMAQVRTVVIVIHVALSCAHFLGTDATLKSLHLGLEYLHRKNGASVGS